MNVVYMCPKKDKQDHHPGTCATHKMDMEKVCAHCHEKPSECICN
ncbi:MAG: hypothetical protein AABY13_02850 [Nanoarchaeota archaeon]